MEGYKSRIGKSQMRQYMGELYEDCMVVYREYIQNACDAIEDAVEKGLITDRKKTTIVVTIDTFNHNIIIEDKGIGISVENIGPYLVDVASSKKVNRAGQYGIGRLNGANYCDQIRYETSTFGEPIKSTLIWNVKKAREICNNPELDPTTEEIIDDVTILCPQEQEKEDEHYCRVTLVNVNNSELMDEDKVIEYIQQIVPVDYCTVFKDNLLKPALEQPINHEFIEKFKSLWIYKISVNGTPVEKRYSSEEKDFEFGSIRCFSLKDNKTQEEFAWGWYAMNKEAKQMNDLPISFIRARHCNYQIGPSTLLSGLYQAVIDQSYFIGEMHLVHEQLKPTASRDGINQNDTKLLFEKEVRKFFKDLKTLYNKTSKFRSEVVDKIADASIQLVNLDQQLKKENDASEIKNIKEKIQKVKNDRAKAMSKMKAYEEFFNSNDSWSVAEDVVNSVNSSTIKAFNNKTEIIKQNLQLPAIKIENFKTKEEPSTPDSEKKDGNNNEGNGGDSTSNPPSSNPDDKITPPSSPSELDIYKGLSLVERRLIKKFYAVIDKASEIPPKIKDQLKNNLRKKIL